MIILYDLCVFVKGLAEMFQYIMLCLTFLLFEKRKKTMEKPQTIFRIPLFAIFSLNSLVARGDGGNTPQISIKCFFTTISPLSNVHM